MSHFIWSTTIWLQLNVQTLLTKVYNKRKKERKAKTNACMRNFQRVQCWANNHRHPVQGLTSCTLLEEGAPSKHIFLNLSLMHGRKLSCLSSREQLVWQVQSICGTARQKRKKHFNLIICGLAFKVYGQASEETGLLVWGGSHV